jgi:hypothetical protein
MHEFKKHPFRVFFVVLMNSRNLSMNRLVSKESGIDLAELLRINTRVGEVTRLLSNRHN